MRAPMRCETCDVDMNRHAEKLDPVAALENPGSCDPDFGAVVNEVFGCPACGGTASRPAS